MITNEELRAVPLFAYLTEDILEWLKEHSGEIQLADGDLLFEEGQPAEHFFVLLTGGLQVTKKIGGREQHLATHKAGAFTGEIPLLTGTPYIASAHALGHSHLLSITAEEFFHMLATCTSIVRGLFAAMASRIQITESMVQQNEKLSGLGKLAAGLAHELNNPAAASQRAAAQLGETIERLNRSAQQLTQQLSLEQWTRLTKVVDEVAASPAVILDTLAQSELEDTLTSWMDEHGLDAGWELASTFATAGISIEQLDQLASVIRSNALEQALSWLEAALTSRELLQTIEHASSSISSLVHSIKEYSYMDKAQLQEIDIHDGIENTLTILKHRLKGQIEVVRAYDHSVPRICAYGSELNQVWTNILDNAIDALEGNGQIYIRTWQEGAFVCVEITDNGPGIPAKIQSRIFEPFFTTKGVGKGTGLGLDTTYRIVVNEHRGTINVASVPGETHFYICLPKEVPKKGEA